MGLLEIVTTYFWYLLEVIYFHSLCILILLFKQLDPKFHLRS